MANNIFENAKFGDKFRTRDGRKAIYIGESKFDKGAIIIAYEGLISTHKVMNDGHYWATPNVETEDDIVSEWKEPINEEELDKLAEELYPDNNPIINLVMKEMQNAFKAGYRTAAQSKWVSVNEKLPKPCESVIMSVAGVSHCGFIDEDNVWYINGDRGFLVTHWMPLPEAPKK